MIRVIQIDPDHRLAPAVLEVASTDDIYARVGGSDIVATKLVRLPDGYDLVALTSRSATVRRNVFVADEQLYGTVLLATFDDIAQAYVHPSLQAERYMLAIARLLVRRSDALACQT